MFSQASVHSHLCVGGGGYPVPGLDRGGGTPSQVWTGGGVTLSQVWTGGTLSQVGVTQSEVWTGGGGVPPSKIRMGGTPDTPLIQDWMGYPPVQDWIGYPLSKTGWGTPLQDWMGTPHPSKTGWGTPPPIRRQISKVSTCYTAGDVPLAFTQEDFLV